MRTLPTNMPIVYTDGSCLADLSGGWAFVVTVNGVLIATVRGREIDTTNNRMELTAVIEALAFVRDDVTIRSDSMVTLNGARGTWKRNANKDLWSRLDEVMAGRKGLITTFEHVKAHAGDVFNEMADRLAGTVHDQN